MLPHNTLGRVWTVCLLELSNTSRCTNNQKFFDYLGTYLRSMSQAQYAGQTCCCTRSPGTAITVTEKMLKAHPTRWPSSCNPQLTSTAGSYDVFVNVVGGDLAIRHGIAQPFFATQTPRFIETQTTRDHVKVEQENRLKKSLASYRNFKQYDYILIAFCTFKTTWCLFCFLKSKFTPTPSYSHQSFSPRKSNITYSLILSLITVFL